MSQEIGQCIIKLGAENAQFISEMEAAKKRVRDYGKDAKQAADVNARMAKGFQESANNTAIFLGPLNAVSGHLTSISSGISRVGAANLALTATITGTIFMMKRALDTYEQWETAQLSNEQIIKSTGYAAGFTSKQIQQLSEEVALNTLASVDGAQQAAGALLTFRSVSDDVFKRAMYSAQDMSQVLKQDLKSSAVQLGKALEDPINGITALKRVGVSFTDTQKEQIKNFVETNNLAKAQGLILDVLNNQMGGSGQAAAKGLAGSWDTLGQQWDTLMVRLADRSGLSKATKTIIDSVGTGLAEVNAAIAANGPAQEAEALSQAFFQVHFSILQTKQKLQEMDADMAAGGDTIAKKYGYAFDITKAIAFQHERIAGLEKQKLTIQDRQQVVMQKISADQKEALDVYRKKEEAQRQIEAEAQKARDAEAKLALEKSQAAGLTKLKSVESNIFSEEEKARQSYQNRLTDIEGFVLSDEAIQSRGFKNIADLRIYYNEMARQDYVKDLDAIGERNDREIEQERVKQEGLITAKKEASEFNATWYAEQKQLLSDQTFSELEMQQIGFESQAEARTVFEDNLKLAYEDRLAYIQSHNEKEIDAENRKWQRLDKEQKKYTKQRTNMEQALATKSLGIIESSLEEGSGAWIAAVLAQQGMMAAQAIMNANLASAMTRAAMIIPGDPTSPARAEIEAGRVKTMGYIDATLIMAQGIGKIAGAREFGGPVLGGYNYLVGENGPEIVSFGQSGTVHPNRTFNNLSDNGGTSVTLYQTIDARGADEGVEARLMAVGEKISEAAYQRVLEDAKDNGPIRRELNR